MKNFTTNLLPAFSLMVFLVSIAASLPGLGQDYRISHRVPGYIPPEISFQNFDLTSLNRSLHRWSDNAPGDYYVLMQFYKLPTESEKKIMMQSGIGFLEYVPKKAFYVTIPENYDLSVLKTFQVRSIDSIYMLNKINPVLLGGNIPEWTIKEAGTLDVVITYFSDCSAVNIEMFLSSRKIQLIKHAENFHSCQIRIPQNTISDIARWPFIMDISPVPAPPKETNHHSKIRTKSHFIQKPSSLGGSNLTGNGVNFGIFDAGATSGHIDFRDRLTEMDTIFWSHHPTACLGSAASGGIRMPYGQGMAPKMNLFSWNWFDPILKLEQGIINQGIMISNHSYYYESVETCGSKGRYDNNARDIDILHLNHPDVLTFYGAGNSASSCPDGWGTIPTYAQTGKNILTVGALIEQFAEDLVAGFSSRGPLIDGRIKPEISAVGTWITTCGPNSSYLEASGTSIASPNVAGLTGQLYERYHQLYANQNPDAALLKALLCNSADDIENPGPDYKVGFGKVNGRNALNALNNHWYLKDSISQGDTNTHTITIPAGTNHVKIMLYWADHEAIPDANPALVNNLDINVTPNGDVASNPWVLNSSDPNALAVRGIDSLNNIEQVTIDNPNAGECTIKVTAPEVPFGPQGYYVVYEFISNYIMLTFPNGGESIEPGPNDRTYLLKEQLEEISWDSYGLNGPTAIQFSTNNGNTWKTITLVQNPKQKYFRWTPYTNHITNQGKIRLSNSGYSSQNQDLFTVFPVPQNLKAVPFNQRIELFWDPVLQAQYYEVFQLVNGEWTLLDTTSTTHYFVMSLTNGIEYWFTVRARWANNAIGNNAYAMNAIPSDHPAVNIYTYKCSYFSSTYEDFSDGTLGITGDDTTAVVQLPFSFKYAGDYFDTIRYCTNGWIQMGNMPPFPSNSNLILNASRFIAPMWEDLEVDDSASIQYKTIGTAPNRVFWIEFKNLRTRDRDIYWYEWSRLNFQVKLFETTNNIEFSYGEITNFFTGAANASVCLTGENSGYMNFISLFMSMDPKVPHIFSSTYTYDNYSWNGNTLSQMNQLVNKTIKFEYSEIPAPILSYPSDTAHSMPLEVTLKWNPVYNATAYRLQVSDSSTFSSLMVDEELNGTGYFIDSLNYYSTYYWRVRAKIGSDSSLWSKIFRFTTVLPPPTLIAPENDSSDVSLDPMLWWNSVPNADFYIVHISTADSFEWTNTNVYPMYGLGLCCKPYNQNTTYFWRVYAKSGADSSVYSETWHFTTGFPVQLGLTDINVTEGQDTCFNATQNINVAGNGTTFTVESGGSVTMIAGQKIHYYPGTTVHYGGYMHGYIAPGGPYCSPSSMPAVALVEDEIPLSIEQSFFKVYPNPTTGNFILELKGDIPAGKIAIDVYGMWGEKVLTEFLAGERSHEFSLSNRPPGIYFIRVISGDKAETVKIIRQ